MRLHHDRDDRTVLSLESYPQRAIKCPGDQVGKCRGASTRAAIWAILALAALVCFAAPVTACATDRQGM
jgi:hypothetical protein